MGVNAFHQRNFTLVVHAIDRPVPFHRNQTHGFIDTEPTVSQSEPKRLEELSGVWLDEPDPAGVNAFHQRNFTLVVHAIDRPVLFHRNQTHGFIDTEPTVSQSEPNRLGELSGVWLDEPDPAGINAFHQRNFTIVVHAIDRPVPFHRNQTNGLFGCLVFCQY